MQNVHGGSRVDSIGIGTGWLDKKLVSTYLLCMAEIRRSSEARQAELTDAALHIIATRGIAALSTRSLAEHVGLSSGAIFRHFASLDALLDAVVARVETVLEATYPPPELAAAERLERFIEARSAVVASQFGILRLVLSEQFLLALPKSGSARLSGCVRRTREFIGQCVREGQEMGQFRADVDADALAVIIMGTVQMLAFSKATPRQRATEAGVVREGLMVLLRPAPTTLPRSKK